MNDRHQERRDLVINQLTEMSGYQPEQEIDENMLKEILDSKKRGVFDQGLFDMIVNQSRKIYNGSLTIESFAQVYCQAEDNLVERNQKIEQAILDHKKKQEEFTR